MPPFFGQRKMGEAPDIGSMKRRSLGNQRQRLIGIVFAQPSSALMTQEIAPSLGYFHARSGTAIDFYFAGYDRRSDAPSDSGEVSGLQNWAFSATGFNQFRDQLASESRWHYSGGCDLILIMAQRDPAAPHGVRLVWNGALVMNLENAKAAEAFPTVGMLFERIFEYAEEHGGELTSVGLSDHFGVAVVKKALGDVLTSFLPEPLRKDAQLARNYVTEDLSKTS